MLVVEDDAAIRTALLDVLSGEGVSACAADNGREALALMSRHGAPSLILLDLMMPEMDGPTFLEHKRADPTLAGVPVIVMTASHRGELPRLDAVAFLRKPFTIHQLLVMLAPFVALQAV